MTDTPDDQDRPATPTPSGGERAGGVGRIRQTLSQRDQNGRPLVVYAILGAGVLALALLMVIVYFSDSERAQPDQPICTSIDAARAMGDLRDGEVERLIVGFGDQAAVATDPTWGPVLARIDYLDGQCANLPQGLVNQEEIMAVIGAIAFYNETTESAQVDVVYNQMADLDPGLFAGPTLPATDTPVPTEASPATPTATPTPTEIPGTPAGTPIGTPAGTPLATETPEPSPTSPATATPTATP